MTMVGRYWVAPVLSTLGLSWCAAVGMSIWFTPTFSDVSLLGVVPLIVPVLLAALAARAAWSGRRVTLGVAAVLLAVFTFISGFSIGGFYLPAAGLLVVAAGWAAIAGTGPKAGAA